MSRSGGGLHLLHVLCDDLQSPAELLGGLNATTSVPANRTGVWPGPTKYASRALDDVSHVLALALVVGTPHEERGQVGVLRIGLEADRPAAVEVLEASLAITRSTSLSSRSRKSI
jgi:hypothetical protein